MTDVFRKDNEALSKKKAEAKIVRDCFESNVVQYLIKFPTESDVKFDYRKNPYISKFTNFVASAINATSGIALKKLPKVDDDDLSYIPRMIGDVMAEIGCDGVGYLLVDAPKLESPTQKTNEPTIDYISISRIVGEPQKDMNGNITDFAFEGQEEDEDGEEIRYRKRLFVEDGKSKGEKHVEASTGKYELVDDWDYGFEGLPVVELDILTARKHPFHDIAENNLWLYNLESDERNIIHFICSPYVQFFGQLVEDGKDGVAQVYIGADRARRFNDKTKEGIEITEAKGSGVEHATKKIATTVDLITRMSASVLTNSNYKTATQAENAESKSIGFLPFVIISVEHAFNQAIEIKAKFRGKEYTGGVTMNKKFTAAEFNSAQLSFVEGLYGSAIITKKTMLNIGKSADLVDAGIDNDAEIQAAEEQMADAI